MQTIQFPHNHFAILHNFLQELVILILDWYDSIAHAWSLTSYHNLMHGRFDLLHCGINLLHSASFPDPPSRRERVWYMLSNFFGTAYHVIGTTMYASIILARQCINCCMPIHTQAQCKGTALRYSQIFVFKCLYYSSIILLHSSCKEFQALPISGASGAVHTSIQFKNCHFMPLFGGLPRSLAIYSF